MTKALKALALALAGFGLALLVQVGGEAQSRVAIPQGSAARPSLYFSFNDRTGFYMKDPTALGFAVDGTEVWNHSAVNGFSNFTAVAPSRNATLQVKAGSWVFGMYAAPQFGALSFWNGTNQNTMATLSNDGFHVVHDPDVEVTGDNFSIPVTPLVELSASVPHTVLNTGGLTIGNGTMIMTILCADSNVTIIDSELTGTNTFNLAGTSTNFVCTANDTLTLQYTATQTGPDWVEVSRSVN